MSYTPASAPALPKPDASNRTLVALLNMKLGDEGWPLDRLAKMMRWHRNPVWLAGVTALAFELGLIEKPKAKRQAKAKAEPEADVFILPVPLRPSPPPSPVVISRPTADRRDPAPWIEAEPAVTLAPAAVDAKVAPAPWIGGDHEH